MQLVNVVEGGERTRMSKRRGEFVTLDELIDDIGVDATRFFMLQRSHDTPIDLDLELARSTSQDNPVYYVQYAHARIASILRKAADEGVAGSEEEIVAATPPRRRSSAVAEPAERALVRRLLELPARSQTAAERRAPHRLCAYAMATAADFHAFYRDCRVVGAPEPGAEAARLGALRGDQADDRDHARRCSGSARPSGCSSAAYREARGRHRSEHRGAVANGGAGDGADLDQVVGDEVRAGAGPPPSTLPAPASHEREAGVERGAVSADRPRRRLSRPDASP